MTWQIFSVVPVWLLALAGAIVIGLIAAPNEQVTWLAIALAIAMIVTFAIQLGIRRKEGFVVRVMASIGGSVVILAAATAILAIV